MVTETFPYQAPNAVTLMRTPQGFFGNRHSQARKADRVSGGSGIQAIGVQALALLKNPLKINPTGETNMARETFRFWRTCIQNSLKKSGVHGL